jgi:hypothetical protein
MGTRVTSLVLVAAILIGTARADHEPATPRNVVEKQLGPLHVGAQLPDAFLGCGSSMKGFPNEEYLAFFDSPDDPTHSAVLWVNVDCLGEKRQLVPCVVTSPRFVKFLDITTRAYRGDTVQPRCQLPLPPREFETSRGIRLGDAIAKVLSRYGPASVNNRLAQEGSRSSFYILYTKGTETGDDREVLFRFENRLVIEIMIEMYGEGEADWNKELANRPPDADGKRSVKR